MLDDLLPVPYSVSLPVEQNVIEGYVTISPETSSRHFRKRPPDMQLIDEWLTEKRRKSTQTYQAYKRIIDDFLAFLPVYACKKGLIAIQLFPNLDNPESDEWAILYQAALTFLPTTKVEGHEVTVATRNQRAAALRSFYAYCLVNRYYPENPLARLKAEKGKSPHAAGALDRQTVKQGMRSIDTHTLAGKRDKAMLALLLQTGRRVSEVRNLTWADVCEQDGSLKLTFVVKGSDVMYDTLDSATQYLLEVYRENLSVHLHQHQQTLLQTMPVFIGLGNRSHGQRLSIQFVSRLCKEHLQESRVHATRHTWAVRATEKGASANDVRKQLGHHTLAHTIKYLDQKRAIVNPWADDLAKEFGITEEE